MNSGCKLEHQDYIPMRSRTCILPTSSGTRSRRIRSSTLSMMRSRCH